MNAADREWITEKLLACGYRTDEVRAKLDWLEECDRPRFERAYAAEQPTREAVPASRLAMVSF